MESIKYKLNKGWVGFVIGLIGPIIGFWIYYILFFNHMYFVQFFNLFWVYKPIQGSIFSISLLFNGILFFAALQLNISRLARGLVIGTLLYFPITIYLNYG